MQLKEQKYAVKRSTYLCVSTTQAVDKVITIEQYIGIPVHATMAVTKQWSVMDIFQRNCKVKFTR